MLEFPAGLRNPKRTIVFGRHGNAQAGDDDHSRRLSAKGREQASAMKERLEVFLSSRGLEIDRVFSSSADRAHETARPLLGGGYSPSIAFPPGWLLRSLYEADGPDQEAMRR